VLDFLKFFLPLLGAALAWFMNERRKRAAEEYERKEKKYSALIDSLQGFYVTAQGNKAQELKAQFLGELNKCWLYCPDDVIRKAYAFLATVHTGANASSDVKERAVGDFILAIRNDLLSRRSVRSTALTAQDFKHLRVN
jgi:hypothetical protein